VLLARDAPERSGFGIELKIQRRGEVVFNDSTSAGEMVREFTELIGWLMRENDFPHGAVLLTGTGLVPPDDFTLKNGDMVSITIDGIGTLTNPVVQANP
jgi:2-dehydro-3-deoxy-D-arabinonate dehydratase